MGETRYYYPEDVIKTSEGTFVGYSCQLEKTGFVCFNSLLPVGFLEAELSKLEEIYSKIWEGARERHRKEKTRGFLEKNYPDVVAEYDHFREAIKQGHSVSSWRKAYGKT